MGRRAPALGYGLAVLLGLLGIVGYLLVSGAAQPLVADAVSAAYSVTGKEQPRSGHSGSDQQMVASYSYPSSGVGNDYDWSDDTWMDDDSRPEWSSARGVPQAARPKSPSLPSRPAIDVPEHVKDYWPRNGASAAAELKLQPMSSCFQQRGPAAQVDGFSVTPGKGSVAISWWDIGDPDTQSYAITAVPTGGGKGVVKTINMTPSGKCETQKASMSGLLPGQVYRFWLTATNKSPINGRIYRPSRGTSSSVVIL